MSRRERLAQLRRQIAAVPARGGETTTTHAGAGVPVLPVPEPLAALLPHGGLVRGSVVSVSGATSLLLGLVASITASGGHVAVVGRPQLGLLAAVEMGTRLDRLALVPEPGPDPVEIAAVLLDGMDLVVLGLGGGAVAPSRARAVMARARSKGCTLVVTDGRWDGAEMTLDAEVDGYDGLGDRHRRDRGRVCSVRLSVRAGGKTFRPRTTRLDVRSARGRVEWGQAAGPSAVDGPAAGVASA
ncbi:hypothetical protein [Rhodococcus sp. HNM0569]|uniref:hypothetical protein n=1 Tax=Rhodococcus sp. HNM0569 TaxID=2716340 RepID=UPI001F0FFF5C|nr:hypothetical protein [Rhodococcus sp. HNM0569]